MSRISKCESSLSYSREHLASSVQVYENDLSLQDSLTGRLVQLSNVGATEAQHSNQ